ncbi:MAG: tRNA (adenosine(37)-N6)-threonylcarbamoyltransferase complex dimerization subunit type 1 TsaB [Candidatus Eisenbacteria bacterium]|nr:tRNA (adenosine(37)-N6)-threonylcarbamoyltransferase complex dimerization subunit type 1 TsaB [Candidatus Eisenbacteria bacterium]
MMILALDTSTRWMAASLWADAGVLHECTVLLDRRMLARTPGLIASMLAGAEVSPADLTACAAGLGPGSYTGLRIGLGMLQGIAASRRIPLLGVASSLAMAAAVDARPLVYVLQESGRRTGHVAFSAYDTTVFPPRERISPRMASPEELNGLWAGEGIIIGDAAVRILEVCDGLTGTLVAQPEANIPRAAIIARIAWHRLESGEPGNPQDVEGIYLTVPPFPRASTSSPSRVHGSPSGQPPPVSGA